MGYGATSALAVALTSSDRAHRLASYRELLKELGFEDMLPAPEAIAAPAPEDVQAEGVPHPSAGAEGARPVCALPLVAAPPFCALHYRPESLAGIGLLPPLRHVIASTTCVTCIYCSRAVKM